jgi:hypothetical protein
MQQEIWKDIPNYEGIYQVSNLGNVKSLPNLRWNGKCHRNIKEKILQKGLDTKGYYQVSLYKNKFRKSFGIHKLVAMAFLKHTPCGYELVVDHINDIKTDNQVENLQIVTQRFNCKKTQNTYSSKYKGVNWSKNDKKWKSSIYINGKQNHLGYFKCETSAHLAYQNKLKQII